MHSTFDLKNNPLKAKLRGPRGVSSQAIHYKRNRKISPGEANRSFNNDTIVSPGATTFLTSQVQETRSRELHAQNFNSQNSFFTKNDRAMKPFYSRGGLLSNGPISNTALSKGNLPESQGVRMRQSQKRPTTAVVVTQWNGRNRRRLASNSILN